MGRDTSGVASKGNKVAFMSPSTAPYSYITGGKNEADNSNSQNGSNIGPKKSSLKQTNNYDTRNSGQSSDFKLRIHHTQKENEAKILQQEAHQ